MKPIPRNRSKGFVLAATLWFIAALTIMATFFADQVSTAVDLARVSQQAANAEVDLANTRAEALFHIATDGFSFGGLGLDETVAIRLDNRPYVSTGGDTIRFQDSRGLLNINFPDLSILGHLLLRFGVPAEKHAALFDALADFTDTDDFRRLNGAESQEYLAAGLPPPANDLMYSPIQLKNVYGWHLLTPLWAENEFLDLLTAARVSGFNPNTAPREILEALAPPGSSALLNEIIRLREKSPQIAREKAFSMVMARAVGKETIYQMPGNSIRILQQSKNLPWATELNLTLTPMSGESPWHIDYFKKKYVKSKIFDGKSTSRPPELPSALATAMATPEIQAK